MYAHQGPLKVFKKNEFHRDVTSDPTLLCILLDLGYNKRYEVKGRKKMLQNVMQNFKYV